MRCAVTLLVALTACVRGEERREPAGQAQAPLPSLPRLLVLTGLKGTTEPCGCTSKPLGGLDRLAARIEAFRAAGPVVLVIVGDTFFEGKQAAEPWAPARTRLIAQWLARLKPSFVRLGPADASARAMAREHGLHVIESDAHRDGAARVAMVVPRATADPTAPLDHVSARSIDLIVGLSALPYDQARQGLVGPRAVDLVISGGGPDLHTPRAGALVLEAGDQGRYLGVLEMHGDGAGAWSYYDAGARHRSAIAARVQRLQQEIATLIERPARQAREEQLTRLRNELAAPRPPPPAGRYLTWRVEPITQDLPAAPWARKLAADYNRGLCEIMTTAARDKTCPPAPSPADLYVGTRTCFGCHEAAFAVYSRTQHAHAWQTLVTRGKACDPGCIGCHSVGYDEPGGYCRVSDAGIYENVGCESCHGPGAGHARAPYQRGAWGERFTRGASEATCAGCHNPEHSDLFDYAAYLPKILGSGHAARR